MVTGRRPEPLDDAAAELRRRTGAEVHALVGDVADPGTAGRTVDEVTTRFGALDVLVLNAGGPPPGRILDVEPKQLHQRVPLIIGSANDVRDAEEFIQDKRGPRVPGHTREILVGPGS